MSLLHNHIDTSRVPFSDRGSRLLVFRYSDKSSFYVKLAERLTQLDSDNEAYLKRPPFIQDLTLIDSDGNPLEFRVESSPSRLEIHTQSGDFEMLFQDQQTIALGLPANLICGIRFRVFPQYWHSSVQGGKFISVRNLVYTTNGEVVRNEITPVEGGYEVEFLIKTFEDCAASIDIYPGDRSTTPIQPFSILRSKAEIRWREWFDHVPPVQLKYARTYAYAWWIMANNLISPQGKVIYEAMTPSKIGYVGLWLWDSALHALAYRHIDPILARNQIRSMLAHQLPNGMLPDAVFDDGVVSTIDHPITGEVTKPPILAWSVLKLHETDPDIDFLSEVYVPLVRLNAWWFTMNDDDGDGLAQYNHPYSSGLDDSPLWDQGMPVESPDLNTYLCIQMNSLGSIAEILHMDAEAAMWRRRAASMVRRMIKHFWDPDSGLFWAQKDHHPIKIVTPFSLYPLWTGYLPEDIKNRLVENLKDPRMFWGQYLIPTVARNDPNYDPQTMWRGPVWANINYFFIEALQMVGEINFAKELRDRTLEMIMAQRDIYEFYDAETGSPPLKAVNNFGWTSAIFIDLAIQASKEEE
jgi:glycogen debranching enzyme